MFIEQRGPPPPVGMLCPVCAVPWFIADSGGGGEEVVIAAATLRLSVFVQGPGLNMLNIDRLIPWAMTSDAQLHLAIQRLTDHNELGTPLQVPSLSNRDY